MIEIDIASLVVLFCNCQLLKDISLNTKCLLVWCDYPVVTCLVQPILGINHPCDTNRLWVFVPNDFMCNWTRRLSLGIYLTSLIFEVRWCLWKMAVFPELWSQVIIDMFWKIWSMTVHWAYCWSIRAVFSIYLWVQLEFHCF